MTNKQPKHASNNNSKNNFLVDESEEYNTAKISSQIPKDFDIKHNKVKQSHQNIIYNSRSNNPIVGRSASSNQESSKRCDTNSNNSSHEKEYKREDLIRVRKKRKVSFWRRHKKLKIILILFLIIIGILGAIYFGFQAMQNAGKESLKSPELENNEGKVVEYKGEKYIYNENIISTLIMGYDATDKSRQTGSVAQADFILLLTLDTDSLEVKGISISRDTMVDVTQTKFGYAHGSDYMQICLAYGYGDGKNESCENTVSAVSRLLYNMPIKNYISLNIEGIPALNDAVGGVTLVPIESIPNTNIVKGDKITLYGKNAERYVRYRNHDDITASEQRRAREVQYIQAFYKQAFSSFGKDLGSAINLFNIASQYSITNLGIPEFSYLANFVLKSGVTSFNIESIQGQMKKGKLYAEYYPDQEKLYELVLNTFYKKQSEE